MTGAVERLAARLRLTEGQLYSSTITLVIAVLLAGGLGNVHGVAGSALEQPLLAPEVAAALPPIAVPTPAPAPGLPPAPAALPPLLSGTVPPAPVAPSSSYYEEYAVQTSPSSSPTPSPTPEPCTAQPAADAGAGLIWTLDDAAGGGLPDGDLVTAIALVTGCTPHRPPTSSPTPSPSPSPTSLPKVVR
jgi:hypothetical protein